ncbi:hypothetical protein H1R20_g1582, partial [Candolleomyces eurysporus]
MPALTELVVEGRQYQKMECFWWCFPDPEVRCPNLRIYRLYTPLSVNPLELAATLKCLPRLTELTLSRAVSDSRIGDDGGYYSGLNCGCTSREDEEVKEEDLADVFRILHSLDQERGSSRSLPLLQVLEILNLPGNYDFSYICDYLAARLGRSPGQASDTLTRLTVTFLPTRLPNNCNARDFKNVLEELGSIGIKASIIPSELEPMKRDDYWHLYPFTV